MGTYGTHTNASHTHSTRVVYEANGKKQTILHADIYVQLIGAYTEIVICAVYAHLVNVIFPKDELEHAELIWKLSKRV